MIRKTVHGGRVTCLSHKFVSTSLGKLVDVLEKNYGSNLEITDFFGKNFDYIKKIKKHYKDKVESRFSDYRQINKNLLKIVYLKKLVA